MKVYLDDERDCPDGYILAQTSQEAIDLLRTGRVTEISLDHDLGDNQNGTGYDVLCYIEEFMEESPPLIFIHTGNASARVKMELALKKIKERWSGMVTISKKELVEVSELKAETIRLAKNQAAQKMWNVILRMLPIDECTRLSLRKKEVWQEYENSK